MTTTHLVPTYLDAASDATHPVVVAGDAATLWGDSDDTTYVEFWRDENTGGAASGQLVGQSAAIYSSATLYVRCMLMTSGNATQDHNIVAVDVYDYYTGSWFGSYLPTVQPNVGNTILDLNDWTWSDNYAGAYADMLAVLSQPDGLRMVLSYSSSETVPTPREYGMRAYEFNMVAQTSGSGTVGTVSTPPLRLYPRSDLRHWPRPGSSQGTSRRVGGYW